MALKPYRLLRTSVQALEDELSSALKEGYIPAEGGIAYQTPIVLVLLENPQIVDAELLKVKERNQADVKEAVEALESPVVDQTFPSLGKGAADVGAGAAALSGDDATGGSVGGEGGSGEAELDPATGSREAPLKRTTPQVGHGKGQVIGQDKPKHK